jgi:hypothetical protein
VRRAGQAAVLATEEFFYGPIRQKRSLRSTLVFIVQQSALNYGRNGCLSQTFTFHSESLQSFWQYEPIIIFWEAFNYE